MLLTKTFEIAKEVRVDELEIIGLPCTLLIGPHRFHNVQFYVSSEETTHNNAVRRYSLSILQKYLHEEVSKKENDSKDLNDSSSLTEANLSTSKSVRDLLSKNPALISLLTHTKKPSSSTQPKARTVFFCFSESTNPLIFPSRSVIEPLSCSSKTELFVKFHSLIPSSCYLSLIIRNASDSLLMHLQNHSQDPLRNFGDFISNITTLLNIGYREISYVCQLPAALNGENLIISSKPDSDSFRSNTSKTKFVKTNGKRSQAEKIRKTGINRSINNTKMPSLESREVLEGFPSLENDARHNSLSDHGTIITRIIAPIKKRKYMTVKTISIDEDNRKL